MPLPFRRTARANFFVATLLVMTACGGGGSEPPPMYSIGGAVSGLDAGQSLTLLNNGGDSLLVTANGGFTFATEVASGTTYSVTTTSPTGKSCAVTDGSGTMATTNVMSVAVACVPAVTYGGTVYGLAGRGLRLELGYHSRRTHIVAQVITITGNGNFVFSTAVPANLGGYGVSIAQQPASPAQQCVVTAGAPATATTVDVAVACEAFAYVAYAAGNTIVPFSINASTGALAPAGPAVAAGQSPVAMTGSIDRAHLYVANASGNDVSLFDADALTGALTESAGSPVATGTGPGALALYVNSFLYVANAGSNSVSAYQIDQATGLPVALSPASYGTGAGPTALVIDSNFVPGAPILYVADAGGAGDISAFTIDSSTGALAPLAGSPFPTGAHVTSLALGSLGRWLYAADASGAGAAIHGYSADPFTGVLTILPGFPLALPSCDFVVADRSTSFLYATAGTNLHGFAIDAQFGGITPLPGFPIPLIASAHALSVDATNQFLYVGSGSDADGAVVAFKLDAATGALTPVPGSPFAAGVSPDAIATL